MDKYFTKPLSLTIQSTEQALSKYYSKWSKDLQMVSHYLGDEKWGKIPWLVYDFEAGARREPIEYDGKSVHWKNSQQLS